MLVCCNAFVMHVTLCYIVPLSLLFHLLWKMFRQADVCNVILYLFRFICFQVQMLSQLVWRVPHGLILVWVVLLSCLVLYLVGTFFIFRILDKDMLHSVLLAFVFYLLHSGGRFSSKLLHFIAYSRRKQRCCTVFCYMYVHIKSHRVCLLTILHCWIIYKWTPEWL